MPSQDETSRTRRLLVLCGCAVLVPVALVAGYGFGARLTGMLLGLVTAANAAVLAALLVDMAVDKLLPLLSRSKIVQPRH